MSQQHPVQFCQGKVALLGLLALGDVEADAGHVAGLAVLRRLDLGARFDPADRPVRPVDAVFDAIVGAGHAVGDRGRGPFAIVGVNRFAPGGVGELPIGIASEDLPAASRAGQLPGQQVELPDAQAAGLGREAQPGRDILLRAEAVAELSHQGCVILLETGQAIALDGHVDLAGEEIREVAGGVADRCQQQPVPERRAVLAMVADVDFYRAGRTHRRPDPGDNLRVGFRTLEEAAVAADDLLPGVAAQAAEGVVGEDDGIIVQPRVGDDHRHAGSPHGGDERIILSRQPQQIGADPEAVALYLMLSADLFGGGRRGGVMRDHAATHDSAP